MLPIEPICAALYATHSMPDNHFIFSHSTDYTLFLIEKYDQSHSTVIVKYICGNRISVKVLFVRSGQAYLQDSELQRHQLSTRGTIGPQQRP